MRYFFGLGLFIFSLYSPSFVFSQGAGFSEEEWVEVFNFLKQEKDPSNWTSFEKIYFQQGWESPKLLDQWIDFLLVQRDRKKLNQWIQTVFKTAKCESSGAHSVICPRIKKVWVGNLDRILFFESSAAKLEQLRKFVLKKDCLSGVPLFNELLQKEGEFADLFEYSLQLGDCQRTPEEIESQKGRMVELRLFN